MADDRNTIFGGILLAAPAVSDSCSAAEEGYTAELSCEGEKHHDSCC